MATEQNNTHINSFTKGMNSDTSYDMISNELYVFGQNIRITNNALINSILNSNTKEGIVTPVVTGETVKTLLFDTEDIKILATTSLDDVGAVIIGLCTDEKYQWYVYRVNFDENEKLTFTYIFTAQDAITTRDKFSVVINKELNDIIKLYISDGEHELMCINLNDEDYYKNISSIDYLMSYRYFPTGQLSIVEKISGTLKTSQVQYTYRFYKKYGVCSKLAPLTTKIQVIDSNRNKEIGNAEDTVTSVGFKLSIVCDDEIFKIFDHILIYRLSYIKQNVDSEIDLIYDAKINSSKTININDDGIDPIQQLSIEEFAALDSLNIIPECIEQNQGYMFEANTTDDTIIKVNSTFDATTYRRSADGKFELYKNNNTTCSGDPKEYTNVTDIDSDYDLNPYNLFDYTHNLEHPCIYDANGYVGGEGKNISWRFITTKIPIDDLDNDNTPFEVKNNTIQDIYYLKKPSDTDGDTFTLEKNTSSNINTNTIFNEHNVCNAEILSYNDLFVSSLFRSLRRDEIYRYGIVLYDKYGRRTDVLWIGDIRTPDEKSFPSVYNTSTSTLGKNIYYWSLNGSVETNIINDWDDSGEYKTTVNCVNIENSGPYDVSDIDYKSSSIITVNQTSSLYTYDKDWTQLSEVLNLKFNNLTVRYEYDEDLEEPRCEYIRLYNVNSTELKTALINSAHYSYFPTINDIDIQYNIESISEGNHIYYKLNSIKIIFSYNKNSSYYLRNILIYDATYSVDTKITITTSESESINGNSTYVCPIGILFKVNIDSNDDSLKDIVGYQIVRCSKLPSYTQNLMQCALSLPLRQKLYSSSESESKYSPYYPNFLLTCTPGYITYNGASGIDDYFVANSFNTDKLFLIFSPEIQIAQDDTLNYLTQFITYFHVIKHTYDYSDSSKLTKNISRSTTDLALTVIKEAGVNENGDYVGVDENGNQVSIDGTYKQTPLYKLRRDLLTSCQLYSDYDHDAKNSQGFDKTGECHIMRHVLSNSNDSSVYETYSITNISNTQSPTWEQGFSQIQYSGSNISSGIKLYKSFNTSIGSYDYNNWVSDGMYDLRLSTYVTEAGQSETGSTAVVFLPTYSGRNYRASGWIGPGPKCFVVRTESDDILGSLLQGVNKTSICNIQHDASLFAGLTKEERQYDTYYGFGNYHNIKDGSYYDVFDGDVYIVPCEITSMYKTYDFNSIDTLPSSLIIYYIPMETPINTYFDYGMCYKNTFSKNIQLEPGEIEGVCSQDRPEHQYNMIYSDNNISNDIFTLQQLEDEELTFTQRIHYSELKTNGESIDSWLTYKAINYIDTDTRYGEITNLLTNKDVLYFWLTLGFGKISVNERSLVTDNNNNTVLLGQGGVLQRTDYINTKYGIRKQDFSAISAEGVIYWIDIVNKAIVMSNGLNCVNYSENTNVLNIVNENISEDIPNISYDLLNNELLCKCLKNNEQIIFNIKYNNSTSVYTRNYDSVISFNNIIYGLSLDDKTLCNTRYNYLNNYENLLSPIVLNFIVNSNATTTKVFDNQEIVTLNRGSSPSNYLSGKTYEFETNICDTVNKTPDAHTDREGNIKYAIPRFGNEDYGNRIRGKWMSVKITDSNPEIKESISHIVTNFRQSFS